MSEEKIYVYYNKFHNIIIIATKTRTAFGNYLCIFNDKSVYINPTAFKEWVSSGKFEKIGSF
jgi:hypothetical protein